MAQRPDGKAAKTDRVAFTSPGAERIIKVVRKVEAGERGAAALRFDRVGGERGKGSQLRLCKTTACFPKGTRANLEIWEGWLDGVAQATPLASTDANNVTLILRDVWNLYGDIGANKFVSVAKHNNGKYLIVAADLT